MGDMKNQAGPVIGDHAETIQEWPFHRGQKLAGCLEGAMGKIFPMSPQALTGQQAQQGGAVLESARPPTTGRGTGPIAGEVLGTGLPL